MQGLHALREREKKAGAASFFPHALSVSASTSPEFPSLAQRRRAELCLCVHKQGMQIFLVTVAVFVFFFFSSFFLAIWHILSEISVEPLLLVIPLQICIDQRKKKIVYRSWPERQS